MRVQDYVTIEATSVSVGADSKRLEAGSFVKPIDIYYVPKHIKEDVKFLGWNLDKYVFCYTHWGITLLERSNLRTV